MRDLIALMNALARLIGEIRKATTVLLRRDRL